jgi:hypothetical protein
VHWTYGPEAHKVPIVNTRPLEQPLIPGTVLEEVPSHRWMLYAAMIVAVFALCFGLGRATTSSGAHGEASPGPPTAGVHAALPAALAAAPAIDVADVPPPRPAPPPRRASLPARPTIAPSVPAARVAPPAPVTRSAPAPAPAPQPAPAPEPTRAPAPAPAPAPKPSGGGSSGSGGGTFDSSG